jgi:hypothetical protein
VADESPQAESARHRIEVRRIPRDYDTP